MATKNPPKLKEPGLRIIEEKIISLIKRGINTFEEILEELKIERPPLYRILKRLEKEGIIIKNIHKQQGYVEHSNYYLPQL